VEQEPRIIDPNKWKPGKYRAKALDWGVGKTKAGLPQVIILFEYNQQGDAPGTTESRQLMWFGSFKEKARERTLGVLVNLGLRGPVSTMENGRDGKALDETKEVEIVVEHRADESGKIRAGVAWVNEIGGRGVQSKLAEGEAKALFADVDAAFMATLAEKGIEMAKPAQTPAQAAAPAGTLTDEDVPF
jgi:hypothetical protein